MFNSDIRRRNEHRLGVRQHVASPIRLPSVFRTWGAAEPGVREHVSVPMTSRTSTGFPKAEI